MGNEMIVDDSQLCGLYTSKKAANIERVSKMIPENCRLSIQAAKQESVTNVVVKEHHT